MGLTVTVTVMTMNNNNNNNNIYLSMHIVTVKLGYIFLSKTFDDH